jgi:hypothetical protein
MKSFSFQVGDDGKLTDGSRRIMANVIASMPGKRIKIAVSEWKESSSDKQRKYYFSVIVPAFIEHFAKQGKVFDKDQMHDSMMRAVGGFSNPYVNPFNGEPDAGRLSYNDLTTAQCEGYHTLCLKWGAENGFQIPMPNETIY